MDEEEAEFREYLRRVGMLTGFGYRADLGGCVTNSRPFTEEEIEEEVRIWKENGRAL